MAGQVGVSASWRLCIILESSLTLHQSLKNVPFCCMLVIIKPHKASRMLCLQNVCCL